MKTSFFTKNLGAPGGAPTLRVQISSPPKGMLDFNANADVMFICVMEDDVKRAVKEALDRGFRG